ncbi:MAG: hypothetical protein EZS28_034318 [Streblomastix strix]|uniref:non-specific serine/threonine protein kinase n=1 Tax=Streblomastix strix TaxID=222440 RepID=A0A5J4UKB3_9EUKA|nr:MAG: hypothetical protein EZS28_034318 [Streblomastix strix]
MKPANVLLTKDNKAKLADFGLARKMREGRDFTTSPGGTEYYTAPELIYVQTLETNDFSQDPPKPKQTIAADIFACGVMLFELIGQNHPFKDEENPTKRITAEDILKVPEVAAYLSQN